MHVDNNKMALHFVLTIASILLLADSVKLVVNASSKQQQQQLQHHHHGDGEQRYSLHVDPSADLLFAKQIGGDVIARDVTPSKNELPVSEKPLVRQKRVKRDGTATPVAAAVQKSSHLPGRQQQQQKKQLNKAVSSQLVAVPFAVKSERQPSALVGIPVAKTTKTKPKAVAMIKTGKTGKTQAKPASKGSTLQVRKEKNPAVVGMTTKVVQNKALKFVGKDKSKASAAGAATRSSFQKPVLGIPSVAKQRQVMVGQKATKNRSRLNGEPHPPAVASGQQGSRTGSSRSRKSTRRRLARRSRRRTSSVADVVTSSVRRPRSQLTKIPMAGGRVELHRRLQLRPQAGPRRAATGGRATSQQRRGGHRRYKRRSLAATRASKPGKKSVEKKQKRKLNKRSSSKQQQQHRGHEGIMEHRSPYFDSRVYQLAGKINHHQHQDDKASNSVQPHHNEVIEKKLADELKKAKRSRKRRHDLLSAAVATRH